MAATTSHPLLTKLIHGNSRAAIQTLDTSEEDHVSIQALKQWCALHKSNKHSDADCRAQQETAPSSVKKRSTVAKKGSKPRRLRFKTAGDKKKFLRSVEGLEGVSLEDGSDVEEIFEQSLMQLQPPTTTEETDEDTEDTLVDLHVLVIQPTKLQNTNVIMEDDELLLANQNLDPFGSNIQLTPVADVPNECQGSVTQPTSATDVFHLEGEPTLFEVIEQASNDFSFSQEPTSGQDRSSSTVPTEHPQESTIKKELPSEAFPPLPSSTMPEIPGLTTVPLRNGPVLLNGIFYQPVPASRLQQWSLTRQLPDLPSLPHQPPNWLFLFQFHHSPHRLPLPHQPPNRLFLLQLHQSPFRLLMSQQRLRKHQKYSVVF